MIAYAFISDPSILDLTPERSVVRAFLDRGFPVYVVDWGDPSPLEFRSSERQTSAGFAGRG